MRFRFLLSILPMTAAFVLLAADPVIAAPASDGSIFFESFPVVSGQTTQQHRLSNSIDVGANPSNGAVRFTTINQTEGVFRAGTGGGYQNSIDIAPYSEFVAEFDFRADGPTGGGFELFRPVGEWAPFDAGILIRANAGSGINAFSLQVDHGGATQFSGDYAFGSTHHFIVHRKANLAHEFDVWVNGTKLRTFVDRAPSVEYQFIQWGDSTGGGIYSNAVLDNVSIGSFVESNPETSTAVPEPAMIGVLGLGAMMLLRRSRAPRSSGGTSPWR